LRLGIGAFSGLTCISMTTPFDLGDKVAKRLNGIISKTV
jgi:hypothetical protein